RDDGRRRGCGWAWTWIRGGHDFIPRARGPRLAAKSTGWGLLVGPHDDFLFHHSLDLLRLRSHKQDVGKLERIRQSHRLDDQVAGTKAENPVAKQVGTLLHH